MGRGRPQVPWASRGRLQSALEVRTKAICLGIGPDPEQSGPRAPDLGTRGGGEEAANCLKPWPLTKALWRSIRKPICLGIGPGPRTIWAHALSWGHCKGRGRRLLEQAGRLQSALEVRTKADLPQGWALTQNNLSTALRELKRAVGERRGRKLPEEAWPPTKTLWRSIRKPICLKIGPGPRTIWASRSGIWEPRGEKKAANCLSKRRLPTRSDSIRKPICLKIGPGPRTIGASAPGLARQWGRRKRPQVA